MPQSQCCGVENLFNDKVAERELKKYRRRGPGRHTARLLKLIGEAKASGNSLLDIGGGVGGIQHTLARDGVASITSVDASPSYLAASKQAAVEQGYADRARVSARDLLGARRILLNQCIDASSKKRLSRIHTPPRNDRAHSLKPRSHARGRY